MFLKFLYRATILTALSFACFYQTKAANNSDLGKTDIAVLCLQEPFSGWLNNRFNYFIDLNNHDSMHCLLQDFTNMLLENDALNPGIEETLKLIGGMKSAQEIFASYSIRVNVIPNSIRKHLPALFKDDLFAKIINERIKANDAIDCSSIVVPEPEIHWWQCRDKKHASKCLLPAVEYAMFGVGLITLFLISLKSCENRGRNLKHVEV